MMRMKMIYAFHDISSLYGHFDDMLSRGLAAKRCAGYFEKWPINYYQKIYSRDDVNIISSLSRGAAAYREGQSTLR